MFLNKLLNTIGLFFTGLFNEAKKAYKELSKEEQVALKTASGVINVINTNIAAAPPFVLDLIKSAFPGLDITKITGLLQVAAKDLGIVADATNTDDLTVLIKNIQDHLSAKAKEGDSAWAKASHVGYLAIAVFLAPVNLKVAAIVSLSEYVYHDLIKGGK